jgi:hypothetical protein
LAEITTLSNEVIKDVESDLAVGITKMGNLTQETAETNVSSSPTAGSEILTLVLQAK